MKSVLFLPKSLFFSVLIFLDYVLMVKLKFINQKTCLIKLNVTTTYARCNKKIIFTAVLFFQKFCLHYSGFSFNGLIKSFSN